MILVEHTCMVGHSMNYTFLYILEITNILKLMLRNMIGQVTRHQLRHLCSQKYEGYQWNMP